LSRSVPARDGNPGQTHGLLAPMLGQRLLMARWHRLLHVP